MSDAPNNSEAGSAGEDFRFVVALCRFESAWKAGERPRIEDFLAHRSAPEQAALFPRLLALEITMRAPPVRRPRPRIGRADFRITSPSFARRSIDRPKRGRRRTATPSRPRRRRARPTIRLSLGDTASWVRLARAVSALFTARFDDELRRMVAVKVPHARWSHRSDFSDQYLAEARTLARLDHPNIVPVFDFGRTPDGRPFVVSKFIEGNNLSEVLNQGRPTFAVTRSIVASVAEALHSAHLEGIVHRDVKPGNILIESSGKAFLADFGMVLREEEFGTGPSFAGTPAYMSPEQARSEGHRVDGRSDVFSLGIVFYQMLTARRPFAGDSEDQLLANLIESCASAAADR